MWVQPGPISGSNGTVEDGFVGVGSVVCECRVHVRVDLGCEVVLEVLVVVLREVGPGRGFGVVVQVGSDAFVGGLELVRGIGVSRVEVVVGKDVDGVGIVEVGGPGGDVGGGGAEGELLEAEAGLAEREM